MKIVETDNFGGDHPNESFLSLPSLPQRYAVMIANAINGGVGNECRRYWKVVEDDYKLQPGFEP